MEDFEKEAKNELIHSLHKIGLTSASGHVRFIQRAVRDCVACMSKSAEPIDIEALKGQQFPRSYMDAYEHVLRHDGEAGDFYTLYEDALKLNAIYPQPYFRQRNRHKGEVYYDYRKKDEYKKFTSKQLDPMYRWKFNLTSLEELLFMRWFVDDDFASSIGIFMEALVACHARYCEACYKCKFRKSLRWNGGAGSSWQDMICTNCGKMSLPQKSQLWHALFPC